MNTKCVYFVTNTRRGIIRLRIDRKLSFWKIKVLTCEQSILRSHVKYHTTVLFLNKSSMITYHVNNNFANLLALVKFFSVFVMLWHHFHDSICGTSSLIKCYFLSLGFQTNICSISYVGWDDQLTFSILVPPLFILLGEKLAWLVEGCMIMLSTSSTNFSVCPELPYLLLL